VAPKAMGGVVRAHYLMCEYLITKSDMGLTADHQDRSVARRRPINSRTLRERLLARTHHTERRAHGGWIVA